MQQHSHVITQFIISVIFLFESVLRLLFKNNNQTLKSFMSKDELPWIA